MFWKKIKIKELWQKNIDHVCGGGKGWPADAIHCGVYRISYNNDILNELPLDVFVMADGTLRLYLPEETKKMVLEE